MPHPAYALLSRSICCSLVGYRDDDDDAMGDARTENDWALIGLGEKEEEEEEEEIQETRNNKHSSHLMCTMFKLFLAVGLLHAIERTALTFSIYIAQSLFSFSVHFPVL